VTVISQKELFERAAGDRNDAFLSSRSLLALVDAGIGFGTSDVKSVESFGRKLEDARVDWTAAIRRSVLLKSDLSQLQNLRQQAVTLQGQVDAFSSPEVKLRLERIESRRIESDAISEAKSRIRRAVEQLLDLARHLRETPSDIAVAMPPYEEQYAALHVALVKISSNLSDAVTKNAEATTNALSQFDIGLTETLWQLEVNDTQVDFEEYKRDLEVKGLSTSEFSRLQDELNRMRESIQQLEEKETMLEVAEADAIQAWESFWTLVVGRREARHKLFDLVHERSGRLRFEESSLADIPPWVDAFRAAAAFRADAFLDEVPKLGEWLWSGENENQAVRWEAWRAALATGEMTEIQQRVKLRPAFLERVGRLEENIRLRLASYFPDDVVMMEFLRENGNTAVNADWQSITEGSPGQRTAAMLAFFLHHGREPLVLDQPEDDLDSEWISKLVVKELRQSRWFRQLIVVSHNANIPVLGDAEQVISLENRGGTLSIRSSMTDQSRDAGEKVWHVGPVENTFVRNDIQTIMEGGVSAFIRREQKYNNETKLSKRT